MRQPEKKGAPGFQFGDQSPTRFETAPVETVPPQSIRLPGNVVNDPRWRAIWTKLLAPVPAEREERAA